MSQADRIATLEYRVAELEAMLARVTRERDILIRRYENPNPAVHQPAQLHQPQHHRPPQQEFEHEQHSRDKAPSGIRLLNARPVPAPALNGRVALPHNHHDPTASVHVQSTAGEEKTLNDLVIRQYSSAIFSNLIAVFRSVNSSLPTGPTRPLTCFRWALSRFFSYTHNPLHMDTEICASVRGQTRE